jgi:hypothetical protein
MRIHLRQELGDQSTRVVLGVGRDGVLKVEGYGIRAEGADALAALWSHTGAGCGSHLSSLLRRPALC